MGSGENTFTYDSRNRQTRVIHSDGQNQENLYDAEGLRCGVKENGKLSRFAYHQGELLYERSDEREVSYHLGGGIEGARMGSELYYYHQDEQLSTALVTDNTGRVKNYYRYDAFGGMLAGEEGVSNRIRYTGQQYDEISEQYYLRARYYNPVVGRFLQEDVYEGDGLNLYAYCGNNPVRYYDPSGYAYDESEISGDGGEGEKPKGKRTGRGKNKLMPDPNATGSHSTFKRDPITGEITRLINLIREIHQVLMKLLDMMVWELRIRIQ